MIFLDKNSEKLTIPRHFSENCTSLLLINNCTLKQYRFEDLVNTSESNYFYVFSVDLSNLQEGEYTVTLLGDANKELEQVLGSCGNYKKERTSYERQNNERKVYER